MKILSLVALLFVFGNGFSQLKINEILVKQNGVLFDADGDCASVVELINTAASAVNTGNFYLSDNGLMLQKWHLPSLSVAAGQKVLVFLSGKNLTGNVLHTSFKLSQGEQLFLSTASGMVDYSSVTEQYLNISASRYPDGNGPFLYSIPSLGAANNNGLSTLPAAATVSTPMGVLPAGTDLVFAANPLPVHYTVNGTEVKPGSPVYAGALSLTDPDLRPNAYSEIPTNPGMNFPIADYTESRANNRGWAEPYGEVSKVYILRTRVFGTNGVNSVEKAYTYFTETPAFNLPIISIITDSTGYFDDETGIYVYGNNPTGNYDQTGRLYERPATFQFFSASGVFEQEIRLGTRIHGNGSRHAPQKVLRLYNRFDYDTTQLYLPNGEKTEVAILRGGGHRPDCIGRDYLATDFVSDLPMDQADPALYAVYLNGEFWGIHDLRARLDAGYFGEHYGLDDDFVAVADHSYEISDGYLADPEALVDLTLFAENNDLSVQANYDYLADRIDMDLLTDLFCSQIFLGNADFPQTNIGFWKYQDASGDSKWRHYFFDLDAAFGGSCDTVYKSFNTLNYYLQENTSSWLKANRLIRNLLENETFKNKFINRMADLMNTEFRSDVLLPQFEEYKNDIASIRMDHVNRWRYPSMASTLADRIAEVPTLNKWNNLYTGFAYFFNERQRSVRNHFNGKFLIPDSVRVTLNVNENKSGLVKINNLYIAKSLSGVTDLAPFPWTGQYFSGIPFPLTAVSKRGYKFDHWTGNASTSYEISVATAVDTIIEANFVADPNFIEPMINEVLSTNHYSYQDAFGQHEDWIELYNKNPYPVTLENYFLTDDLNNLTKFRLKARNESVIPANGYQVFFASEERNRGPQHTNFKLSKNESVFLVAPDSVTIIDEIEIPELDADESYGSYPNGSQTRVVFAHPTPMANNNLTEVVEIQQLKKAFTVYPNPNDGTVVYTSVLNDYKIYNTLGALIQENKQTKELHLGNLSRGTYLVVNKEGSTQLLLVQ